MQPISIARMPRSQYAKPKALPTVNVAPLPLPREIYLESTNRCNELCDQCPRTHLGREDERDLSLAETQRIADQLPDLERVVLHGLGEPLLNPALPAIIADLRRRGAYVLFNTNATALSARMAQALIAADLNELRISLDGATPGTYARVRGVSDKTLPKILRNVAGLTAMQRELGVTSPRLSFWFTAMKENLPELPQLVDLALQTGVREIYVQRFIYFGEGLATEDQAIFRHAQTQEVALIAETERRCEAEGILFRATGAATPSEYIEQDEAATKQRPWSACQRPSKLAYITARGNVFSCCFAPFHPGPPATRVLGNVFETPFAEIWNGPRYQAFRAAFTSDEPWDQCAGCGSKWSL